MILGQQDCLTGKGSCCQALEFDFSSLDICFEREISSQKVSFDLHMHAIACIHMSMGMHVHVCIGMYICTQSHTYK